MKKFLFLLSFFLALPVEAAVSLPYSFSTGQTITASSMNADLTALMNEINSHESSPNGHNTSLQNVLSVNNSCGTTPINFNLTQALSMRVENLVSDPTPGNPGRLFYNTTTNLLKVDTGTSDVSIAGTGVNNLSSVLISGNSVGGSSLDMNEQQLLHARVENVSSDPSSGNTGRLFYNTTAGALKLDTGSGITAIGGSQALSSVLSVGNSAGSFNLNFNGNQALNLGLEQLASDPGTTTSGRIYYNTAAHQVKFYNGSAWSLLGNTNTLAQTLALGNGTGGLSIDFGGGQAQNLRLHNLAAPPGTGTAGLIWYDTINNVLGYETTTANHTLVSLDDTQTLSNKTISGAANTITNVPDSALSANIGKLNSSQTITGAKTFSTAPTLSRIQTPAGTTTGHQIPNGLSDDTFVLANAVQTLSGKTLNAPTLSGNLDFAEYQGSHMRIENVASVPAAGNPGRIIYKSATGELDYDNGTAWLALGTASSLNPNLSQVLATGNSAGSSNLDLNEQQLLHARAENVSSLPGTGNAGRLVYNTTNSSFYVDNGTSWNALTVGGITATTGDVSATGPGSVTATVNSVGGSTASNVHSAEQLANAATSSSNASTIVKRDISGNFTAGTITANLTGSVTGHASLDVATSSVGANSGVASLDSSGKVPVAQLPSVVMEYEGTWNPSTNTPSLSDATGSNGNVYYVSAAFSGTVSGLADTSMTNFQIGDLVMYSAATGKWEMSTPAAGVKSVNGAQGATTVNAINQLTGDLTAGPASGSASAASTIAANAVSNSKMAQMGANTIKGNNTGSTANASDLTVAQVNTMLGSLSNPMTTLGDTLYGGASGAATRIAGNTSATKQFLTQTGTGSVSAAPAWGTLSNGDLPSNQIQSKTGAYTTVANDNTVIGSTSGGTFAITLIGASSATKPVRICKGDTSANLLTIARGGTDTIQGASGTLTSTVLHENGTCVSFTSDGSSKWYMGEPERIERITVSPGSSCAIVSQSGNWVSSVVANATGDCSITPVSNIFSADPSCTGTIMNGANMTFMFSLNMPSSTKTSIRIQETALSSGSTTVSANGANVNLTCFGPR